MLDKKTGSKSWVLIGENSVLRSPVKEDRDLYYKLASDEKTAYFSDDRLYKKPQEDQDDQEEPLNP